MRRLRPAAISALCCAAALAAPAAAQRPVTHEDVWLFRRLGTPVPSPDGRQVVFSVTEPSYDPDEQVSDLWIVSTDGSAPARRLTATAGSETGAVWSPDGSRLAFAAKRGDDAVRQIYVLGMNQPGEARRVTTLSTGATDPKWSPDGEWLAYESRVYPGAADDDANRAAAEARAERKWNASAYETFPVRYWDHWLDDRSTHLFVQPVDDPSAARDLLAGTAMAAAVGFSGVPGLGGESLQAAWAPAGGALVFVATTKRHQSAHATVPYHLYRVPVGGGEPTALTADQATYSGPVFAPDGALFCTRRPTNGFVYNLPRVARLPWPERGAPVVLGAAFDRPADGFAVAPDGETLFVLATDRGRRRIFRMSADDPAAAVVPLDRDSRGVFAGVATPRRGAGVLVARWEDSTHPAEIVAVDPATGARRDLTAFNTARAAELDWQPFWEFSFESARGRSIHCWMALPPGFDEGAKYPVVVFMHGGPHASSLDAGHVRWSAQLLAAPGYIVVLPDYTGSVGYGESFARAIQGDPLRTPGEEVVEAVMVATERYPFADRTRLAAAGASYGGHLANWLEATTDQFRCLVSHAGLISLEGQWSTSDVIHHREINNGGPPWGGSAVWRDQSPSTYAGAFKTPMLLTIGESDYRVPLNQTLAAWSYLRRQQVESRLVVFHDANHWVMRGPDARHYWEEVHAWLARFLLR